MPATKTFPIVSVALKNPRASTSRLQWIHVSPTTSRGRNASTSSCELRAPPHDRKRFPQVPCTSRGSRAAQFLPRPGVSPQPPRFQHAHRRHASSDSKTAEALQKTALFDLHVANGGKMVPFGGYSMPVQYTDLGIGESHKWTREKASLFDVGHMCDLFPSCCQTTTALRLCIQGTAPPVGPWRLRPPREGHTVLRRCSPTLPFYSFMPPSPRHRRHSRRHSHYTSRSRDLLPRYQCRLQGERPGLHLRADFKLQGLWEDRLASP